MDPNNRFEELKRAILSNVPDQQEAIVFIPNWSPINIEMGLKWIKSSINEGYYIKHKISSKRGPTYINLISWEYGVNEPEL